MAITVFVLDFGVEFAHKYILFYFILFLVWNFHWKSHNFSNGNSAGNSTEFPQHIGRGKSCNNRNRNQYIIYMGKSACVVFSDGQRILMNGSV